MLNARIQRFVQIACELTRLLCVTLKWLKLPIGNFKEIRLWVQRVSPCGWEEVSRLPIGDLEQSIRSLRGRL